MGPAPLRRPSLGPLKMAGTVPLAAAGEHMVGSEGLRKLDATVDTYSTQIPEVSAGLGREECEIHLSSCTLLSPKTTTA